MPIDFSQWGESNSPEDGDLNFAWRICRASHLKPTKIAVISAQHYGVYTHYYRGRTVPHMKIGCDACKDGMLPRWYGYVLAVLSPAKENVVFEFSAKAAETIIKAEKDYGSLRGLIFTATRPKGKENSPVVLQLHDVKYNPAELPPPESIRPILAHIWGFKDHAAVAQRNESVLGATEAQLASTGFSRDRVPLSTVALNQDGEIQGVLDVVGKLPSDDIFLTADDRKLNGDARGLTIMRST